MKKHELKKILQAKQLVKPNKAEERLSKEVESLCDGFTCTYNTARAAGDTEEETDILF